MLYLVLTNHDPKAEEQLMELTGERTEETSESGDEASHDGREAGGLPATDADRQGRDEQGHRRRHRAQPAWKK